MTGRSEGGAGSVLPPGESLHADVGAWDAFVAATPLAPYLQASPWAEVKARNGWNVRRIVASQGTRAIGSQLLLHRLGPTPWSIGYAPRGPVAAVIGGNDGAGTSGRGDAAAAAPEDGRGPDTGRWTSPALDEEAVRAWTDAIRRAARDERLSHVVIDPEIEAGGPELEWFVRAGWRRAPSPQPARSRWVDLTRPEDELWADLRGKWRQYVGKARRSGVAIVDAGPERLGEFYAIYVETARRAGFTYRTEATYRATYEAYARHGRARLLFAVDGTGQPQATLLLVGWGRRIVEPYGGMTQVGADSRANYLLKWEAIRSSRGAGYELYDMWGLSHAGIEHFKTGFGGREVEYIGGLELTARPLVRRAVEAAQSARVLLARRKLDRERLSVGEGGEPA